MCIREKSFSQPSFLKTEIVEDKISYKFSDDIETVKLDEQKTEIEEDFVEKIDKEIETLESEISLVPETSISTDLETSIKIYKLLEALEDLDDTQNVHSNADFPEEIVEHLD